MMVLPPSLYAAMAAMRPLMVAEPMLRAPSPEMTPESSAGARPALAAGACATSGAGFFGGINSRGGFPEGNRKSASAVGAFASADSRAKREFFGPPFFPDSI